MTDYDKLQSHEPIEPSEPEDKTIMSLPPAEPSSEPENKSSEEEELLISLPEDATEDPAEDQTAAEGLAALREEIDKISIDADISSIDQVKADSILEDNMTELKSYVRANMALKVNTVSDSLFYRDINGTQQGQLEKGTDVIFTGDTKFFIIGNRPMLFVKVKQSAESTDTIGYMAGLYLKPAQPIAPAPAPEVAPVTVNEVAPTSQVAEPTDSQTQTGAIANATEAPQRTNESLTPAQRVIEDELKATIQNTPFSRLLSTNRFTFEDTKEVIENTNDLALLLSIYRSDYEDAKISALQNIVLINYLYTPEGNAVFREVLQNTTLGRTLLAHSSSANILQLLRDPETRYTIVNNNAFVLAAIDRLKGSDQDINILAEHIFRNRNQTTNNAEVINSILPYINEANILAALVYTKNNLPPPSDMLTLVQTLLRPNIQNKLNPSVYGALLVELKEYFNVNGGNLTNNNAYLIACNDILTRLAGTIPDTYLREFLRTYPSTTMQNIEAGNTNRPITTSRVLTLAREGIAA